MASVTIPAMNALRLATLRLVGSDARTPAEAVRSLLALQAQDFPAVKWAIGTRTPGSTLADVHAAFDDGSVVRSWPMRGTLHAVAAEDLRWILDLTAERTLKGQARPRAERGLDDATIEQAARVARELLQGGGRASRSTFLAALDEGGVPTKEQAGYHVISHLAHSQVICWGPMAGDQQALVLCDEWLPPTPARSRDETLGMFLLRYLQGHGPATLQDFSWWNKLTVSDSKRALDVVRDDLAEMTVEGASYWIPHAELERASAARSRARKSVLLLPAFDEHLLGYQNRSSVLDAAFMPQVVPGNNGIFKPTVVIGGEVAGTWARSGTKAKPVVTTNELKPFSSANLRAVDDECRRYADFLGTSMSVRR
jgi:hypothetical protein